MLCQTNKNKKPRNLSINAVFCLYSVGSPTWTRTRDLRINSPSLYRLSYQGTDEAAILMGFPGPVNTSIKNFLQEAPWPR